MMRGLIITILFISLFSCGETQEIQFRSMVIHTLQPEVLHEWYTQHLGFEPIQKQSLYRDDFTIHFKSPEELLPDAPDYRHGFFKVGFQTDEFDDLFESLQQGKVEFVGDIFRDHNLSRRSFVVKDPDGNRLQFFENKSQSGLQPYFLALLTPSIGEAEKWYQMRFPVMRTHNLDLREKKIYIRLLEGEDFAIEIIENNDRVSPRTLGPGFHQLEVGGIGTPFEEDKDGNSIISNL
ncbi:MAG: VOC family protein [Marinoscillum sp.]|uniref:VOC family protein n=1 Tax=Marinoscillum sp. TaxID=2024838 RepID=UPI0032F1D337